MPDRDFSFIKLIAPFDAEIFFRDVWEQKPLLVSRQSPGYYAHLLSLSDLDDVLTKGNVKYPDIRLTTDKSPPASKEYTYGDGCIDPVAVCRLHSGGTTVIFDNMQFRIPGLGSLCNHLAGELGIRFQTNLYLTPPRSGGSTTPYDPHDVFVMQVSGNKDWELFESPINLPMPDQHRDEPGASPSPTSHN